PAGGRTRRAPVRCMSATRSGVLERLRNKGLSGPSLSCTSVLQMRRVDHLESALWRDAYRAEFSTQIGQSRAEFGARVGARRSRQTFPRAPTRAPNSALDCPI